MDCTKESGIFKTMTNDGLRRVINMKIEELYQEIEYLTDPKVNPPSRHEGETINEYANGMIARINNHEIEFLKKLLKQLYQTPIK